MNDHVRILCVDDEPKILNSITRIFLDYDYEILTSCSAEDGLKILEEN